MYLQCPNWFHKNRNNGEHVCTNRLSAAEAEKIEIYINRLAESGKLKTGEKFKVERTDVTVQIVDNQYIKVFVK